MNKISHIMLALNARIPATPKDEEVQQAFRSLSLEVTKIASEGGWDFVTAVPVCLNYRPMVWVV